MRKISLQIRRLCANPVFLYQFQQVIHKAVIGNVLGVGILYNGAQAATALTTHLVVFHTVSWIGAKLAFLVISSKTNIIKECLLK